MKHIYINFCFGSAIACILEWLYSFGRLKPGKTEVLAIFTKIRASASKAKPKLTFSFIADNFDVSLPDNA
jgi:hypothetical protein